MTELHVDSEKQPSNYEVTATKYGVIEPVAEVDAELNDALLAMRQDLARVFQESHFDLVMRHLSTSSASLNRGEKIWAIALESFIMGAMYVIRRQTEEINETEGKEG